MKGNNTICVALCGMGTVGTGVYKVLRQQAEETEPKLGVRVELKWILDRALETVRAKVDDPSMVTDDWSTVVNDPEVDIVIELIGGTGFSKTVITDALKAGKHVVTANKDLIAIAGGELLALAHEHGCDFLFEASVGGGIPIIRPLKQCLAANHMEQILGIVNGTTNFILTKMAQEGMDFDAALALAKQLGYAEANPTSDIEGIDAARKVAILASCGFNSRVTLSDVDVEGITGITAQDIAYAAEMSHVIKLIGACVNTPEGIEASVHPMLVPNTHPLASVNDSFNAIFVHGDAVGDAMFYGRGAGEMPTASAVVGDVFDIARNIIWHCNGRIGCTCYKQLPIKAPGEIVNKYYIRLHADDRCGVLSAIAGVFGSNAVNIEQIIQNHLHGHAQTGEDGIAEIVVMTDSVKNRHLNEAIEALRALDIVRSVDSVIRVYAS